MRKGFSLLTAIIFIVLVATIAALSLSLSSSSAKQTSDIFLREQAELLLQSATEYALLAISAHTINTTNGCLNTIIAHYPDHASPIFDINISINYLGKNLPKGCKIFDVITLDTYNNISTDDSNVTVIIDTIVQTNTNAAMTTEPIRLHRRTLQKP